MKRTKSRGTHSQVCNVKEIIIALLIFACVIATIGAITVKGAETNTTEDGNYKYTVLEDGTIEITEYKGTETKTTIPKTIEGKTVTSIGEYAFYGCEGLSEITIPEGVTSIGKDAFCRCTSLSEITIPEGVASIGGYAFCQCTSLSEITISEGVISIGGGVFEGCSSLVNINVVDKNKNYSSEKGVLFNKAKTTIICYPRGKQESKYTIPEGVTRIDSEAFDGCSSLKNIEIPTSVTSIGVWIFRGCSSLSDINVEDNNKNYSSEKGVLFNKAKTTIICYPAGKQESKYTIPEGVTSIRDYAFEGCKNLTEIEIPEGVISIGSGAFDACMNLTSIEIPKGVTSIENETFYFCINLTKITIPEGVTSIGEDAFRNCTSLSEIIIPEGVTSIGRYAFLNCKITITVPYGTVTMREIELPEIIKRAMDENDILYSSSGFELKNCSLSEDKAKLEIDTKTIAGKNTYLRVKRGALEGLYIVVGSKVNITSEKYEVGETNITKIQPKTILKEFKANVETNAGEIKVYTRDNDEVGENEIIGTGSKLELELGNETRTFTLIVAGDTNGDGEVKLSDMTIVNKHRLNKKALEGEYLLAGDVTGDDKVDIKDIVKINRYRLHKIDEL